MSAQGLLHNPAMFVPVLSLAPTRAQVEGAPALDADLPHYMRRRRKVSAFFSPKMSFSYQTFQRKLKGHKSAVPPGLLILPQTPTSMGGSSSFFSSEADVKRQFNLASEYLSMCDRWPPCHPSVMRRHIFFLLFDSLQANVDLYDELYEGSDTAMA